MLASRHASTTHASVVAPAAYQAALLVRLRRRGKLLPRVPVDQTDPSATAIVTGAASGLGQAVAAQLAAAGLRVVLAGRSLEGCVAAAAAIRAEHPDARLEAFPLDLSTAAGVGSFVASFEVKKGSRVRQASA